MSACNCMGCPHRANCRCRCTECQREANEAFDQRYDYVAAGGMFYDQQAKREPIMAREAMLEERIAKLEASVATLKEALEEAMRLVNRLRDENRKEGRG